jgi:hypothetical protein
MDHGTSKGFAQWANMPFSIEALSDFHVGQVLGEIPYAIDNCGRVSHAVGSIRWDLQAEVTRGATLPSHVNG